MSHVAAVYLRQSLDRTGEELAVTRQREDCLALCERNGWKPVEYVDNDTSASDRRKVRPAYEQMVRDYEAGKFGVIVCWDLDRLTRQPRQLEDWIDRAEERGLRLVTANGEADLQHDSGRMFARIKAAVARQEMERKSSRQKRSAAQRAERGEAWWPRRPFGLNLDGTLHPTEAPALEQVYRDLLAGKSLRQCVLWLTEHGFKTNGTRKGQKGVHGKDWTTQTLRLVLLNPRNAAICTYQGEEIGPAQWEAIVTEDIFRAVVRLLTAPGRSASGGKGGIGNRLNLLTGLIRCGQCDGDVSVAIRGKGTKSGEFKSYACRNGRCVSVRQGWADGVVVRKCIERVEQWKELLPTGEDARPAVDVAALQAEEKALAIRKEEFVEDRALGLIDRKAMLDGIARVDARTAEIATLLADHATERHGFNIFDTDALFEWATGEDGEFDVNKVRPAIDRVVKGIKIYPLGKGNRNLVYGQHLVIEFNDPGWTQKALS